MVVNFYESKGCVILIVHISKTKYKKVYQIIVYLRRCYASVLVNRYTSSILCSEFLFLGNKRIVNMISCIKSLLVYFYRFITFQRYKYGMEDFTGNDTGTRLVVRDG